MDKNARYKLCGKFKKLERLIHSTNSQWWDKYFLNQYLKNRISPRGLRILKNCSFLEPEDAKEWGSLAEFCTTKWMTILVKHREKKFENLKKIVETLSTDIVNAGQNIPSPWLDIFKNNTKKQENDLIFSKIGKFRRDILDYSNKKVFTWMKKPTHIPSLMELDPFSHSITSVSLSHPSLPSRASFSKHKTVRGTECSSHIDHHTQRQDIMKSVTKSPKAKLLSKLNSFYNRPKPSSTNSIPTNTNKVSSQINNLVQITEMDISTPLDEPRQKSLNINNTVTVPCTNSAMPLSGTQTSICSVPSIPSIGPKSTPQNTIHTPITFGSCSTLDNPSFLSTNPSTATQTKRKFVGEAAEGEEVEIEVKINNNRKRSKSLIYPNILCPQQKSPC